jgi:hypothetical protein
MAWTRRKSVAWAIIALLLIGTTAFVVTRQQGSRSAPKDIQGDWEGTLHIDKIALRLVFHFSKKADGGYSAMLDSPDQGGKDVPATSVSLSNSTVRVDLSALSADYEGTLNPAGAELVGQFKQLGTSRPLILTRTERPTVVSGPLPAEAFARRPGSDLQGYWKGTLDTREAQLRVAFKISEPTKGTFAGVLDSLDQGARNIPLTTIAYTKPAVKIDVAGVGGHFEGELNAAGTEISGTWEQVGRGFPLVLKQSAPSELEPNLDETAYVWSKESDLQGHWNGTLRVGGGTLRLALHIARTPDGSFNGTMDSLDQGAKDLPVTTISYTGSDVQLEWHALNAAFRGKLEKGKLNGTWEQAGGSAPLVFERTNQTAEAAGRIAK